MSALGSIGIETHRKEQLPLRDWILLPASALLTILVIAISTELVARRLFPVSQTRLENCFVTDDPSGTAPAKPNSVCSERLPESRFTAEYRFNNRGDRDDVDLEAKQLGTFRIVMIGSSFAMGLFTPREMTFAALLPKELSRRTGRKIEVYNEAKGGKFRGGPYPIKGSAAKFDEVLSAQPDMILWVIAPMDIENSDLGPSVSAPRADEAAQTDTPKKARNPWGKLWDAIAQGRLWGKLHYRWEQSRSSLALEHYLIASESPGQYLESYVKNDSDAEFLKTQPSPHWQSSLNNFEVQAAAFERQASSAGVPLVAVLLPNRAQAAMITSNFRPSGYDPYKLAQRLRAPIETHGGTLIDILPKFRNIPDPVQYYFPVDGHLNSQGHAAIARVLSDELTGDVVRPPSAGKHLHQTPKQGK
jgi:murein DD-endopeptidase MepM/ murein hydrolase activator NlpD